MRCPQRKCPLRRLRRGISFHDDHMRANLLQSIDRSGVFAIVGPVRMGVGRSYRGSELGDRHERRLAEAPSCSRVQLGGFCTAGRNLVCYDYADARGFRRDG